MHVVHFQRKPGIFAFSVEGLFQTVRNHLPKNIFCSVVISRYLSRGICRRIYNILEVVFKQGDVNHITGDVHYLCYLMHKKRTILTILDCGFTHEATGIRKHLHWFFWFAIPLKRVAFITVISEATKKELLKHISFPSEKILVIPCCVSPVFHYSASTFNSTRPKILHIGTTARKNILRLAEALKGISCQLEIVGHLTEEQILTLADNRIDYTNCMDITEEEMFDKYRACDMLAFVSMYEGFGMPILEANATGRPVITSNILSMPEVSGDSACLVDPYSVEEIRTGILRIIGDSQYREQLVINGINNARRYSPKLIAQQYAELYREVYCKPGRGRNSTR